MGCSSLRNIYTKLLGLLSHSQENKSQGSFSSLHSYRLWLFDLISWLRELYLTVMLVFRCLYKTGEEIKPRLRVHRVQKSKLPYTNTRNLLILISIKCLRYLINRKQLRFLLITVYHYSLDFLIMLHSNIVYTGTIIFPFKTCSLKSCTSAKSQFNKVMNVNNYNKRHMEFAIKILSDIYYRTQTSVFK